jgi:signal transduction histidine kinase
MATRELIGGWSRTILVSRDSAGRRRAAFALYLLLAPMAVALSLVVGTGGHGNAPILVKAAVLAAALVWIWRRSELSQLEWFVLLGVIPAISTTSTALLAGPDRATASVLAMGVYPCITAIVCGGPIVFAATVLQLIGLSVVQFHQQTTEVAAWSVALATVLFGLAVYIIYSTARQSEVKSAELEQAVVRTENLSRENQTLIDQLPGAIFRFDVAKREMLYASPQVERLTGEPADSWMGAVGYARWSSSMVNPSQPNWEELGRSGVPWQNEYEWRRPDGEVRTFRSITRIVAPNVVQSLVTDATEEAAAEQALQVEQRRYRALVEQMPAVILRGSADGLVEYVSPQVEEQFQMTPAEYMAAANSPDWLEWIHPDDRDRVAKFYAVERQAGNFSEIEVRVRGLGLGDAYRTLLVRRAMLEDPDIGGYYHSVLIDVTDLRAAEARSRQALAALVRASEEEQARLAVELHDDTVQVLTAVLLQMHRVQRDNPVISDAATMLEGAIERTRRLMFELRPEVLEREGVGAALARVTRDGPWSSAEIDLAIPRQSDTVEALCYRTLRELVINARKHSNANSLRITGREVDGRLQFTVEDDGDGFEPLEALDREHDDLHIGLRTVVERVRIAGGDVEVRSSPGAGTRVRVTLPAESPDAAPADTAA